MAKRKRKPPIGITGAILLMIVILLVLLGALDILPPLFRAAPVVNPTANPNIQRDSHNASSSNLHPNGTPYHNAFAIADSHSYACSDPFTQPHTYRDQKAYAIRDPRHAASPHAHPFSPTICL